jgi:hypothetical protein
MPVGLFCFGSGSLPSTRASEHFTFQSTLYRGVRSFRDLGAKTTFGFWTFVLRNSCESTKRTTQAHIPW